MKHTAKLVLHHDGLLLASDHSVLLHGATERREEAAMAEGLFRAGGETVVSVRPG